MLLVKNSIVHRNKSKIYKLNKRKKSKINNVYQIPYDYNKCVVFLLKMKSQNEIVEINQACYNLYKDE